MSDNQSDRPENAASTPHENDSVPHDALPTDPPAAVTPAAQAVPSVWTGTTPPHPGPPYGSAGAVPAYPAAPQRPAYAGAPTGQAFGVQNAPTQPTLPLGGTAPSDSAAPTAPRRKSSAGKIAGLLVAAALVGGAAGLGGSYAGVQMWGDSDAAPVAAPSTITVNDTDDVNATTAIAAKVVPSVVTIAASSTSGGGTGSGVVLSEDGYVLTNTHVVTLDGQSGDASIQVTTSDGRIYAAEIVGTDPTYDLAVIRMQDASGLTPIEFADSSALNVGDETVAIGAPLGLSNTVTTGIVSALNRSIEVASAAAPDESEPESEGGESGESPFFFDFGQGQQSSGATETIKIAVIQTDAAINPGNSGGALVDGEGKLIGINVAIASAGSSSGTAGSIGVGFAIPSEVAERVADEIIETGSATHGLLGATVQQVPEGATIAGAAIRDVVSGAAADQAGLRAGDIVTAFNGIPVTSSIDLTAQVRALAAGSETTIDFVRDGQAQSADVTLGTLEP